MQHRNKKFVIALSLLLILSQWLSLTHTTHHLANGGDAYCQVCTLQHHFQSATINALACNTVVAQQTFTYTLNTHNYTATPEFARPIRAPPQ